MKEFGIIHHRFWEWAQENELSESAKLIAVYLLTCRHANSLGCFRIPYQYASADLGYPIDRVSKGYSELQKKGFIRYCEQSKYVFLPKYLRWNPPQNVKHAKGIYKLAIKLPSSFTLKDKILESCEKYLFEFLDQDAIDTLYHTLSIPYQEGTNRVDIPMGNTGTGTGTDTGTGTGTDTTNCSELSEHTSEPATDSQNSSTDENKSNPKEQDKSPVVYEIPLSGKDQPMFGVTQEMIDDWQEDFPAELKHINNRMAV